MLQRFIQYHFVTVTGLAGVAYTLWLAINFN